MCILFARPVHVLCIVRFFDRLHFQDGGLVGYTWHRCVAVALLASFILLFCLQRQREGKSFFFLVSHLYGFYWHIFYFFFPGVRVCVYLWLRLCSYVWRRFIPIGMVTSGKENCQSGSLIFFLRSNGYLWFIRGIEKGCYFWFNFLRMWEPRKVRKGILAFYDSAGQSV